MERKFKKQKVKEIAKIFSGATPDTNDPRLWNGDIVWITPNDLSKLRQCFFTDSERKITDEGLKSCSANLVPKGTIVMSSRAPIGYLAIGQDKFATNQGCKSIVLNDNHDPLFFYYNFQKYVPKLKLLGEGTTFAEISKSYLEEFEIEFPEDKPEQTRIAEILSTADQAIEQTEALIAKYQRIKTGLMQDLLTRGIDEHGNIRSKAYHKFVMKNGMEVPDEWEVEKLETVCSKIQDGTHFSPPIDENGEFKYVTSKNIRLGYLDLTEVLRISAIEHNKIYKRCEVKFGDVLLTKDGANTGNVAINTLTEEFSLLSSVCFLRGKPDYLKNEYLLYWLMSENGQRKMKDSMTGLAITRITLSIINKFQIPLPPIKEQLRIINCLTEAQRHIDELSLNLIKLCALKTGLMQDLLSGKVSVKTDALHTIKQ